MSSSTNTSTSSLPTILPLGALLQKFPVGPDNHNIVLSFDTPEQYVSHNGPYFGETIGRVCNRISNAKITDLNGQDYPLAANNGPNCLHGGLSGWGKKVWSGPELVSRADADGIQREDVQLFRLTSPDGDEGFPGALEARVWYFARREANVTTFEAEYEVVFADTPSSDSANQAAQATVVAVTNHAYFNVTAGPTIRGTRAVLAGGSLHLPVDANQIPTGEIAAFPGLPSAPGAEFELGATAPQVDHCMVMPEDARAPGAIPLDTRPRPLQEQIRLTAPDTGITLVVSSTEPAFQLYTGDGISVDAVGEVPARGARAGVAIEPSRFVNAVNGKGADGSSWRGQVLLERGAVWGSRTRYVAWT